MYNINYYKQNINSDNTYLLNLFLQADRDKLLYQPKIFCDQYDIHIQSSIPIFHSYYIRQHFNKSLILSAYEDLSYIKSYNNENFLIIYDPLTQNKNTNHKYMQKQDNFYTFLSESCNEYKI